MQVRISSKKGQLASLDFTFSLVLFISIFIFILSLWTLFTARLNENIASEELQLVAFQTSDFLVRSRGVPDNWEKDLSTTQVIGLRLDHGSLDQEKIFAFLSFDYTESKKLLKIERFDYFFQVFNRNGTRINVSGIPPNGTQSMSLNRIVLVENEPQTILFTLWKK